MKIKKGEEAEYKIWHDKNSADLSNLRIMKAVEEIGGCLDKKEPIDLVMKRLKRCPCGIRLENIGYVALVISIFHERGDEFRFGWNKFWRGEDKAIKMENKDKRLYNPSYRELKKMHRRNLENK